MMLVMIILVQTNIDLIFCVFYRI